VNADGKGRGLGECWNSKWGYIDKNGTFVIPFRYDHAGYFINGHACVIEAGQWMVIDRMGKATSVEKNGCSRINPKRPN
jgi:WG containing repeat